MLNIDTGSYAFVIMMFDRKWKKLVFVIMMSTMLTFCPPVYAASCCSGAGGSDAKSLSGVSFISIKQGIVFYYLSFI